MQTTIVQRLGRVLYWIGCGLAGLLGLVAAYAILFEPMQDNAWLLLGILIVAAVLAYLVGRAFRYILANE